MKPKVFKTIVKLLTALEFCWNSNWNLNFWKVLVILRLESKYYYNFDAIVQRE